MVTMLWFKFFFWVQIYCPLFLDVVMYDKEVETNAVDKMEPQYIQKAEETDAGTFHNNEEIGESVRFDEY